MIRPGLYRDKHGVVVRVLEAGDSSVTLLYPDGTVVTVAE